MTAEDLRIEFDIKNIVRIYEGVCRVNNSPTTLGVVPHCPYAAQRQVDETTLKPER
jgi:hypothetical protein